jgi:hypothetical protein
MVEDHTLSTIMARVSIAEGPLCIVTTMADKRVFVECSTIDAEGAGMSRLLALFCVHLTASPIYFI